MHLTPIAQPDPMENFSQICNVMLTTDLFLQLYGEGGWSQKTNHSKMGNLTQQHRGLAEYRVQPTIHTHKKLSNTTALLPQGCPGVWSDHRRKKHTSELAERCTQGRTTADRASPTSPQHHKHDTSVKCPMIPDHRNICFSDSTPILSNERELEPLKRALCFIHEHNSIQMQEMQDYTHASGWGWRCFMARKTNTCWGPKGRRKPCWLCLVQQEKRPCKGNITVTAYPLPSLPL